jgi:hypothetical protein
MIIYKSDLLRITLLEKSLKTQQFEILDSRKTIQNSNISF